MRRVFIYGILLAPFGAAAALAQAVAPVITPVVVAAAPFQLNLTDIIVSIIGVVGSTILALGTYLINSKIANSAARDEFNIQLKASLGALQQAASGVVVAVHPTVTIPGVPADIQPAAQYMLDHAGASMQKLGIDGPMLASHIIAAIGTTEIAANVAVAAGSGTVIAPVVVTPRPIVPPVPVVPPSPLLAATPAAAPIA
jgi:hypothetical protein